MIRELFSDPATALAADLRARILERHRAEAVQLIADAMGKWRSEGFRRYDNRENSCTVRIFDWMLTLLEAKFASNPVQIIPVIEGVTPNADQLAGRAHFANAKRPDLVLYLGGNHAIRMCVECKRFLGAANANQYTGNGMFRFLSGQYVTDAGRGVMIGYVMTHSIERQLAQVNARIREHPRMGEDDQLGDRQPIAPIDDVHVSAHAQCAVVLTHLLLDMRDAVKNRQGLLKPPTAGGSAA
jgi:hypothetical protein